EAPGDRHGERQRREVAAVLDRVDRLARDAERGPELPLGETTHRPPLAYPVLHMTRVLVTRPGVKPPLHVRSSRSRSVEQCRRDHLFERAVVPPRDLQLLGAAEEQLDVVLE